MLAHVDELNLSLSGRQHYRQRTADNRLLLLVESLLTVYMREIETEIDMLMSPVIQIVPPH